MSRKEIYKYIEDGSAVYSKRADRDIERNRKGDFKLIFKNGGINAENVKVSLKLKRLDFDFGANIFMLGEYESDEKNRLYEQEFVKIFNTAVVPLYWEGTEPQKGNKRYDISAHHDVYRRPPADYVADFCRKNNLKMKGHVLLWHEFIPKWLPENYCDLKPLISKRFAEISERYADEIEMFDVVNEPSRIYDVYMRDRYKDAKCFVPEDDYCIWAFNLARQYFPSNKLILNDTVGASFHEFRGKYSGYYLNIKDLLSRGASIDEIGMQCHLGASGGENVYNAERLYNVLDTYASLNKTINISEISIPSRFEDGTDEDLQAAAAEQLYKTAFSHDALTGIMWWNLPDDGVMATRRKAGDENMPSTALIDKDYNEKKAYKVLCNLINNEWTSSACGKTENGCFDFRGFYGTYELEFESDGRCVKKDVKFLKNGVNALVIDINK